MDKLIKHLGVKQGVELKFKPKVTRNREATKEEIDCIKETEEMLKKEQKLPPASQQIRDLATTHW